MAEEHRGLALVESQPLENSESTIQLCQCLAPDRPYTDCAQGNCCPQPWQTISGGEFQLAGPGEFVVRPRTEYVPQYRLRPDDELEFVFRITRNESARPYEINVGDEIRVESFTDKELDRTLIVQPDGTITLRLLGQVRVTHHTVDQLREEIESSYKKFYKVPAITVTPIKVNTKLEDLRATVDSRAGSGGQGRRARVTPEGTIALPAVGSVPTQGLTLEELKRELDERYAAVVDGIEVTPVLVTRAPRYIFVVGEVKTPGRFNLEGPTTVMQALALAGSWNVGANVNQVVIFRRADDWRLLATTLDLREALLGRKPCPASEIWVADSDLIIVPKSRIMLFDNFVDLVFTKGIYGLFPPTFGSSLIQMNQFRGGNGT
jgi:polysaccharide export outer membrane protein